VDCELETGMSGMRQYGLLSGKWMDWSEVESSVAWKLLNAICNTKQMYGGSPYEDRLELLSS